MTHTIVYADPAAYAGWPANHGAWQWGDEFLVGFLRGRYQRKSMHNIVEPFEKMLARSTDGGQTWKVFSPEVVESREPAFECAATVPSQPLSFRDHDLRSGNTIMRVCGVYDHGGDYCNEAGGFYISGNRGYRWLGPFSFAGLESEFSGDLICTARTALLPERNLVFLSNGQRDIWGTDATFCAELVDDRGQASFRLRGWVCADNARAAMPAVAETNGRIVVALRRRKSGVRGGWIDAFGSDDGGYNWRHLSFVGDTGGRNGNPPALVSLPDGGLCCAFGNRDHGSMVCAISRDGGVTWRTQLLREGGDDLDIGYPRLFLRPDGVPVCVYYWADSARPQQHIVATAVNVS